MPYTLRKPIGPVENQMLRKVLEMLRCVDPKAEYVHFVLPSPSSVTQGLRPLSAQHREMVPIYTVDRSPVGEVQGKPVLVITLGKKPVLLISPWYQMIVEEER